jgi:hypothetical protein
MSAVQVQMIEHGGDVVGRPVLRYFRTFSGTSDGG